MWNIKKKIDPFIGLNVTVSSGDVLIGDDEDWSIEHPFYYDELIHNC